MNEKQIHLPRPVPIPARVWGRRDREEVCAYVAGLREDLHRMTAEMGGDATGGDDLVLRMAP